MKILRKNGGLLVVYCETNQICSSSHVFYCKNRKICGWQFEACNLRISGVWHVGWWHLITSVRLIQVVNNRNDHFRYFLGVRIRLIKVSFKANKGNKFWDFGYCPLDRGCPLNKVSNRIVNTVMIRFSALLPISAPFQISAPLRMCFC